jgi:hypothetical protein
VYRPYDYIYAEYKPSPEVQALFETYLIYGSDSKTSIFRGVDRIKLLISIVEAKSYEGGAGLHISNLLVKKAVLAAFPLHEFEELNMLQQEWLVFFQAPSQQPVGTSRWFVPSIIVYSLFFAEKIKNYFGERIGLYFVYLGYSCNKLMLPAFFGLFSYICK